MCVCVLTPYDPPHSHHPERHLKELRTCNPVLLSWALRPGYTKNNLKVFWFTRDIEVALMYADYLELGFRLGELF